MTEETTGTQGLNGEGVTGGLRPDLPVDTAESNETYTITQLAEDYQVTPRALRFYESKGLLSPARRGLTRLYSRRDRARLDLVLRGKRVGFSLAEIREMLDLYDVRDGQKTQLRHALRKFRERIQALERQRDDIDQAINSLQADYDRVAQLADAAPDDAPEATAP